MHQQPVRPRDDRVEDPPRAGGERRGNVYGMQVDEEEEASCDYEASSPRKSVTEEPMEDGDDDLADAFGYNDDGANEKPQSTQMPKTSDEKSAGCEPCGEHAPRVLRSPVKPSKEDVERHYTTHLQYRSWCPICVQARGREDPHKRKTEKAQKGLPVVSLDYVELDGDADDATKTIVAKDEDSGAVLQYKILMKGPKDDWLVKRLVRDIEEFGRTDIRLKTDGEPAIIALQAKIQEGRGSRTVPVNPPAYNPQSNGSCEKAVRDCTEQTRVLKLGLEARLGVEIKDGDKILEWIYVHAAFLLTRYSVGHDGMTPWERLTGVKWERPAIEIGEVVLAKLASKRAGKMRAKQKRKLGPRSVRAVWVGQVSRTGEHIVIGPTGDAARCRTVFRVPEPERWDKELVLAINGTPRTPGPTRKYPDKLEAKLVDEDGLGPPRGSKPTASQAERANVTVPEPEVRGPRLFEPRRFRITDRLMKKYGMSDDCKGCSAKRQGLPADIAGDRAHSTACRQRFEERMRADDKDKDIIDHDAEKFTKEKSDADVDEALFENEPIREEEVDNQEDSATINATIDPEDIPELDEDVMMDKSDEPENEDAEPSVKKQRLERVSCRPPLETTAGRTLAGQPNEEDIAHERLECLKIISKIRDRRDVRQLIKDLEKQNKFKLPEGKVVKKTMRAAGKNDVSEVYSPPRIAEAAAAIGLKKGWSLDVTINDEHGRPWNFADDEMRRKAMAKVKEDQPYMLVCSPMCGPFSELNELFNYPGMDKDVVKQKLKDGLEHVHFCLELCLEQYRQGRAFMFEHPAGASTWSTEMMDKMKALPGVEKVTFDFCMLGMVSPDKQGENMPVRKKTSIITNSSSLQLLLKEARCRRLHAHKPLLDGAAKACEIYPEKFCRLVCEAVKKDIDDLRWRDAQAAIFDITQPFGRLMALQERAEQLHAVVCPPEEDPFTELYDGLEFVDDVTGEPLVKEEAVKARRLEMEFFKKKGVYSKIKRQAWMKVITTRWLDINKGDAMNMDYRARLVGREIKRDRREDLFAATPPLESLRMILSICASHQNEVSPCDNFIVMTNDVKRAYFHAAATRPIFIKIPKEDHEDGDDDKVGQLNLSLYGTRDAAQNWSRTVTKMMTELGFTQGDHSPCNFRHDVRGIIMTVHGDDFTSTGREADLRWLDQELRKKVELKTAFLGPDPRRHSQQIRVLNRVITWQEEGLVYEADQRHAEIIVRELNLEQGKPVATPGTRDEMAKASMMDIGVEGELNTVTNEDDPLLGPPEATRYRALAARANYLAQDRPETQYAIKEIARRMATPRRGDWNLLKRLGRYLLGTPRAQFTYYWQHPPSSLEVYVDSDWAGCKGSCRSTSGGAAKLGFHTVKTWATTQAIVALSSGEAELYALTKGAANALGLVSLAADFGLELNLLVHTDASAAVGIVHRQGVGKLRHIRVQYLWVQQKVQDGELSVHKVPGQDNPADLMTKHLPASDMYRHLEALCVTTGSDRAQIAPRLARVAGSTFRAINGAESEDDEEHHENGKDHWIHRKEEAVRRHRRPRQSLFTPLRVGGAPPVKTLTPVRVTEGQYCDNQEAFRVVDCWTSRTTAHRSLTRPWIGTTTFLRRRDE